MLLRTALEQIPGIDTAGISDVPIHGVSYDSRTCGDGYLFVAIKGANSDGARFIRQAVANGAVAVAAEHPIETEAKVPTVVIPDARKFLADISRIYFQDPASKLELAAITGTNGKTTTAYLIDSIFCRAGIHSCLAGTIEMKAGSRLIQSRHTTPEASDLTQFLQGAVQDGCTHGVLEVSSHALSLKRVLGIRFKVGVFMNLTRDHLDFHRTMEDYFRAKQLLFSTENGNRIESAVINTDDDYGKQLKDYFKGKAVRFGFNRDSDIHVLKCDTRADGTDLRLATPVGEAVIRAKLIGRHNVYNIMAATGAALSLDMDLEKVREGIESLNEVPGRCECVEAGQDFTVIVDYAHTPDALDNLLNLVSEIPHERILTVFGCGGDRDKSKRPIMGSIAVSKSDLTFVTSDNPRSEDPLDIINDIMSGIDRQAHAYSVEPDRREAIGNAVASARKSDIVVIAGKGHEDYQLIKGIKNPFDDRKVAREMILKKLKDQAR